MADERDAMRISDEERRQVDRRLQQALAEGRLTVSEYEERSGHCWAARIRRDLEPLTQDLPAETAERPPEKAAEEAAPARKDATEDSEDEPAEKSRASRVFDAAIGTLAVIGGLFGVGYVVTAEDGVAVFGDQVVQVSGDTGRAEVGALFGSVDVVVPEGVRAETSGLVVFGSTECASACATSPGAGTSSVVVDTRGAFGSVEIVTPEEHAAGGLDDD
ncbi:DUF1707 SHOCT-like domain-containing protein [Bounagaea algeriensis]